MAKEHYRVVQWATGSIGQIAIRHFADNPIFELAGVYVTSAAKVGRDAGALAGIAPTGVAATDDVDAILALGADCVHYAPLHADVDVLCRILRSGTNVVTPVGFVYPTPSSAGDFDALRAACAEGGASFHGTGIHPGFSGDLLPLVFSRVMSRIDQVQVREVADFRLHPSKAMQEALGFGRDPVEAVEQPGPLVQTMDRIFEQSMTMVVEGLGREVERFTVEFDVATAKRDLHVRSGLIPAGTVGGMRFVWTAWVDGQPLVVFRTFWKMDDDLEPDWGYGSIKYSLVVDGDPSIEMHFESARKHPDGDEGYWGRVWTAMNGINVIPTVCDAPPGVLTHLDLPLARPQGLVRPRAEGFGEPPASLEPDRRRYRLGVERTQLDDRSWVDVGRGWFEDADALYEELTATVPWQASRVFKYDHWFEEPRLGAWVPTDQAHPRLLEAQRRLQHEYGVQFGYGGFSMVWYRDGRDHMAIHRDRDMKWLDETVVAVLTLGAERPWVVRPRANRHAHELPNRGATHDFRPASGDVLVLGGACQAGWEHGVPQVPGLARGRISVQWRWTSKRGRQELGGSYRKPLRYSGR